MIGPKNHPAASARAVFLTSQSLITRHWSDAARLLNPVLPHVNGEFTVEDLEELCRDGRAVAGIAFNGDEPVLAMVFEFRFFPRKTVVNVIALAGRNLGEVASTFWPSFVDWCRESGATDIQACARPAVTRMLGRIGFAHTYNVVRMSTEAAA